MKANPELTALLKLAHSPIKNYIVPGLTSYLIGNEGPNGCIRLFVSSRMQHVHIAPHSHRYDFVSRVIQGQAVNRTWVQAEASDYSADIYMARKLTYKGSPGAYDTADIAVGLYTSSSKSYRAEQDSQYSMSHKEIHSIVFGKDAAVLIMQGPEITDSSIMLLPFVEGEVCNTAKVEPWMFKRVT